jgi:putative transposase
MGYRQREERRGERGGAVDPATLTRGVIKDAPEFEKQFRRHQQPLGWSGRLEETDVKIKGEWAYWDRAVEKDGHTIDSLLTPTRDWDAAEAF